MAVIINGLTVAKKGDMEDLLRSLIILEIKCGQVCEDDYVCAMCPYLCQFWHFTD